MKILQVFKKIKFPKFFSIKLLFLKINDLFKIDYVKKILAIIALIFVAGIIAVSLGVLISRANHRHKAQENSDKKQYQTIMEQRSKLEESLGLPKNKEELAQKLLLPDKNIMPWPFALNARVMYTDRDLEEMLPDLGAIDISEMTQQRKAELEAIYNAVD